ncbi:efflux RND transporter periplasmic adaptor subunit [Sandaracinobacter neustonicus]|uniref:Efflux RND transporter periplasmic adaptor subunit n=1 Tax=Sandaracinobacter neustonicus TaxID=1715348 RepID=A0A501XVL7_9SPHN|nr:efflux RND transporter periplasmic adaptor subunit [Sandaracinobacter neustonicus]TPE64620.1 efflux RND transporter periplasmic adaptor subunit [Sandaracinobacter neustonicus]
MSRLRQALDALATAGPDRLRDLAEFQSQLLNSEAFAIARVTADGDVLPETLEPPVMALARAAARDGVAVEGRGAAGVLGPDDAGIPVAVHRLAQDTPLAQALARERLELIRAIAAAHAAGQNPAMEALLLDVAAADWTDAALHQLAVRAAALAGAPRLAFATLRRLRVVRVADSQTAQLSAESRRALELAAGEVADGVSAAPSSAFTGLERLADGAALHSSASLSPEGDGLVVLTWPPGDGAAAAAFARRAAPVAVARLYRPTLSTRFDKLVATAPWPASVPVERRAPLARRGLAALLLLALLLPLPDRVRAPLTIEPLQRRVVTAPITARIDEVAADPGDQVQAGAVLVRFDSTQIERDRDEATAALQAASTQAAAARADGDVEAERLAQLKAAQLAGQVALLETRLGETIVRAPIAGTVNGEDLRRRVGATMGRGDTLFSIAAPGGYRAELLVGDSDVGRVQPGAAVSMRLASRPLSRLSGTVSRVYPLSEVVEGRNIFRTLVTIDASDTDGLRAGMSGSGSVTGGWAPLGWQIVRPAVRWVRLKLWV